MKKEDLKQILEKHALWLIGDEKGTQANLSCANLSEAKLSYAKLSEAYLSCANLNGADLSGADLIGAYLSYAKLSGADLSGADLSGAYLSEANMSCANLSGANLSCANMSCANLSYANLSYANLSGAKLNGADLRKADLSGAKGLLSPIEYIQDHFEKSESGFIAYKTFGGTYEPNTSWVISVGETLEENVDPTRTIGCGCGINIATLDWVKNNTKGDIWKVLIKFEWLPGVVVPYNTNGKIRCGRVQLIEKIER